MFCEEPPISTKAALVNIAHDYTKRRCVFRLETYNGDAFLFQADSHEDMLLWIQTIQQLSNPDQDVRVSAFADMFNGISNRKVFSVLAESGRGQPGADQSQDPESRTQRVEWFDVAECTSKSSQERQAAESRVHRAVASRQTQEAGLQGRRVERADEERTWLRGGRSCSGRRHFRPR